jgi:hypothetical protein
MFGVWRQHHSAHVIVPRRAPDWLGEVGTDLERLVKLLKPGWGSVVA